MTRSLVSNYPSPETMPQLATVGALEQVLRCRKEGLDGVGARQTQKAALRRATLSKYCATPYRRLLLGKTSRAKNAKRSAAGSGTVLRL